MKPPTKDHRGRKRTAKKKEASLVLAAGLPQLDALGKKFEGFLKSVEAQMGSEEQGLVPQTETALSPERRDELAEMLGLIESHVDYIRKSGTKRHKLAKKVERMAEQVLFNIQLYMEMKGIKEIQGMESRFVLQKNPPSVFIQDESAIPEKFLSYKPQPDKEAIKEALQKGEEVLGAVLREDSYRVEVK